MYSALFAGVARRRRRDPKIVDRRGDSEAESGEERAWPRDLRFGDGDDSIRSGSDADRRWPRDLRPALELRSRPPPPLHASSPSRVELRSRPLGRRIAGEPSRSSDFDEPPWPCEWRRETDSVDSLRSRWRREPREPERLSGDGVASSPASRR